MTVAERPSRWRQAGRWLPGILISIVALFLVIRLANWKELNEAWLAVRPLNLVVVLALTVISMFVRAALWKVLLGGRTTIINAFFIINIGYLLNNLFPLRAGEIGRAVFMGRSSGLGPFHTLSTIVLERAFDMVMAATILLATLPLAFGQDWMRPVATVTLVVVLSGLVVLFLMARYSQKVQDLILRIEHRWPLIRLGRIKPQINALLDGLSALRSPRVFGLSLFWLLLSWAIWQVVYYVMLLVIAPGAPFWWAMFLDGVLALGMAIPSAPAGLGIYEASTVAALTLLGIAPSAALAYAVLMHFIQFAVTAIFGFWALAREGRSITTLWSEINLNRKSQLE